MLNRAAGQTDLFKSIKDHQAFQATLREAHAGRRLKCFDYCVMSNHWHLVIRPKNDGDLSSFMQWLTLAHAQRWRAAHRTVGHGPLYQGRFKAFAIEEDQHLLTVLRYVERNPVRAGLIEKAEDWRWSSLHTRLFGTVEEKAILAPWPIDVPANWTHFVNTPQTTAEEEAMKASITRSRPYGSAAWQDRTAKRLGLLSCFRPLAGPKSNENHKIWREKPREKGPRPLTFLFAQI